MLLNSLRLPLTAINAAIDALVKVTNVSSLTATGVKELTVTFNAPVDNTLATFAVKKGSVTANVSSVTWNTEKTEATLAMTSKLTEGTYKATVTGIDLGVNNASVDVENEVATSIALLGNDAAVNTGLTAATMGYVVYNQYGEDITKTAPAIAWSQSKGTADDDNEGILTLTAASTFAVGDKVTVTGVISSLGVVLNQQVTIGDVATISEVTFEGVYNADDEVLQTDSTFTEFVLLFEAKDQYGNVMTKAEINKALISSSKTTVLDFNAASPNTVSDTNGPDADQIGIVFKAPASPVAGTSTVRLISTATGEIFSYDVTVKEAPKVATLTLSKPDDLVAAGETVNIPFVAADQYGEEITSYTTLSAAVGGDVTLTQSPAGGTFKFVNDVVNKKAVLQYTPATDGTKVLSASTTSGGYSQISIDVEEEAVPTVIVGIQDVTKDLTVGGKSALDYENVIVNDQYGRVIDMADLLGTTAADFKILATSSTANVTVTDDNPIDATDDEMTLNGATKGSSVITLALQVGNAGAGVVIANSEYTFTSKVTETTSSTEYVVDDLAVLYEGADAAADHVVPVVVKAVNGTTTIMPLDSYTVSVLDPASEVTVDPATQKLTAQDGPAADSYYATGANTREVTVITTVNGVDGPVSITKTLTVSKEARKAVSLVLQDGTLVKESSELLSVDTDTINAMTQAEFITALESNLLAKDQYAVAFATNAYINSTVVTNLPDTAAFATGPATTDGTFAADDTFKVTVITKSGITKVINITVTETP